MSEIYQTTSDGKMRVLRPGSPGYEEARRELASSNSSALVGRCTRCFAVNAVDIDNTPENRKQMEMPGRRGITVVTQAEAIRLSAFLKRCECFASNDKVER
jgi:hypothetical protein